MYGVYTKERERREGRSVGSREILGMREKDGIKGGEGKRMEQEEETGSSEPPQNGLFRICMRLCICMCVCMCICLLCTRPTPPSTAHQQTARISYFVRRTICAYTGCPGYLTEEMISENIVGLFEEIGRNLKKKSLSKTSLIMLDSESSDLQNVIGSLKQKREKGNFSKFESERKVREEMESCFDWIWNKFLFEYWKNFNSHFLVKEFLN